MSTSESQLSFYFQRFEFSALTLKGFQFKPLKNNLMQLQLDCWISGNRFSKIIFGKFQTCQKCVTLNLPTTFKKKTGSLMCSGKSSETRGNGGLNFFPPSSTLSLTDLSTPRGCHVPEDLITRKITVVLFRTCIAVCHRSYQGIDRVAILSLFVPIVPVSPPNYYGPI